MFYESQELLRIHAESSVHTGEPVRRQLQLVQPERAQSSQILRFITCGSVDDGKSTLIGRMLKDSGLVPEDTWENVLAESERRNFTRDKPDYSLLLDGLLIEREQGITVDVAWRYFTTSKRKFIVADCPGHEHYTRNMVTGASNCDAALVLVDARTPLGGGSHDAGALGARRGQQDGLGALGPRLFQQDSARRNRVCFTNGPGRNHRGPGQRR